MVAKSLWIYAVLGFAGFWAACGESDKGATPGVGVVVVVPAQDGGGTFDAGVDAGQDAGQDAGPTIRTLNGVGGPYLMSDQGLIASTTDYTNAQIIGFMEQPDGGFTSYPGYGLVNRVTIPYVPNGPLLVRIVDQIIDTTERDVDLTWHKVGRRYIGALTSYTPLTLNLSGMSTFVDGDSSDPLRYDEFVLVSSNVNLGEYDVLHDNPATGRVVSNKPASGSTSMTGTTFDMYSFSKHQRLDGASGDVMILEKYTNTHPSIPRTYAMTDLYIAPSFTVVNGQSTTLTGTFTPVPQDRSVTIDWRLSQFAPFNDKLGPGVQVVEQIVNVNAHPNGATWGFIGKTASLAQGEFYGPYVSTTDQSLTLVYGNSLPASWEEFCVMRIQGWAYLANGSAAAAPIEAGFKQETNGACPAVIEPVVSVVEDPKIEGRAFDAEQDGVGLTPKISWSAPLVGQPSNYRVSVYDLKMVSNQTVATRVVTISTKQTAARIPPGILVAGHVYALTIEADVSPIDVTKRFYDLGLPFSSATRVSPLLRP